MVCGLLLRIHLVGGAFCASGASEARRFRAPVVFEVEFMAVPGLKYVAAFLSSSEEAALLDSVDAEPWRTDLKRRVQHYGYRYDYTTRTVDSSAFLGMLPAWAQQTAARLVADGHMSDTPNQLIVNEYEPGQGINAHIDSIPSFGPIVCSLTLGSHCVMELSHIDGGEIERLLLEPASLVVLAGDARYKWRHGIPARTSDTVGDTVLTRSRRVSLTFRTVNLANDATSS
jgi:alkylated DNA repair dioxygenase AlkB